MDEILPIRLWRGIGLLLLILVLTSACGQVFPQDSDPVAKIGLVAPFEGRYRDIGYDVIYSARLAVREANARRGPGETKVALVAVDDFGDPEFARDSAEAMAIDPDVVAVFGHWLPETTAAGGPVYLANDLAFLAAGEGLFGTTDPAILDPDFLAAYEEVTPFDERAGPYAGTAYDGMHLILAALSAIEDSGGDITRSSVRQMLESFSYTGMTGTVRQE